MLMHGLLAITAAGGATATAASAQEYGITIRSERTRITPRIGRVDVRVFAWFEHDPPRLDRFRYMLFDLVASELGLDLWGDCSIARQGCIACFTDPGPRYLPGRIEDIASLGNLLAPCPDNPILVGGTSWGPAPGAGQFAPRTVRIGVENVRTFQVFGFSGWTDLLATHPAGFQPGELVLSITACEADMDIDGELTFFDFLTFLNLYAAGSREADCNFDGWLDFEDFLCFQNDFAAGCP